MCRGNRRVKMRAHVSRDTVLVHQLVQMQDDADSQPLHALAGITHDIMQLFLQELAVSLARPQQTGMHTASGRLSRAPSSASSFPQLSSAHSFPRSSSLMGSSGQVRSPSRPLAKRTRSPQLDSSPSSGADRLALARKNTPEISATDTDDSTSGDGPHKRRKGGACSALMQYVAQS